MNRKRKLCLLDQVCAIGPPAERDSHRRGGGEIFGMSKSTGNLQFSPTYRALPKNIIELEKKGLGWELSGARQPSTLSLCATIVTKTILYGSRDAGGR